MWCLYGLKSTEELFSKLRGQEKPWGIFTDSSNLHKPTQFLSATTVTVKGREERD